MVKIEESKEVDEVEGAEEAEEAEEAGEEEIAADEEDEARRTSILLLVAVHKDVLFVSSANDEAINSIC